MKLKTGRSQLAYTGVQARTPPEFLIINRAPTVNDYKDYYAGTFWLHMPAEDLWLLVSKNLCQGNWIKLATSIAVGIETITGNVGGAVGPDPSQNVDLLGVAPLVVTGNPGTNTLSIGFTGNPALEFIADVNYANPDAAGDINILGGSHITTTGDLSNTLTIDLDTDIAEMFTADTGWAAVVAGNVNILGGTHITTTGDNIDTITIDFTGDIATQYDTDSGSAVPALGILQVLGGELIGTTGGTNIVTANLDRGTDGQIIVGASGAASAYTNLTSSDASITIAEGPNTLDITTTSPVIPGSLVNFRVSLIANQLNTTGDGTWYNIPFDKKEFDVGNNWNIGTGRFVAPVKGIYCFMAVINVNDTAPATRDNVDVWIRVGGTYTDTNAQCNCNYPLIVDNGNQYSFNAHALSKMDVGGTAYLQFQIGASGAKDITTVANGGIDDERTWFAGFLVAEIP